MMRVTSIINGCDIMFTVSIIRIRYLYAICFFFQAEDGIRYLVRSRGLGDVYKRQIKCNVKSVSVSFVLVMSSKSRSRRNSNLAVCISPVSYTHLTLPTSDLVQISVVAVSLKKKTTRNTTVADAYTTQQHTRRTYPY